MGSEENHSCCIEEGLGGNSIFCIILYVDWMHKSSCSVMGSLSNVNDFTYRMCSVNLIKVDSTDISNGSLQCVVKGCCLGDITGFPYKSRDNCLASGRSADVC